MPNPNLMHYFFEIYEALPRQGPGDSESTRRALQHIPPLRSDQRLLDIGCGTGAQTIDLARFTAARLVAVDNHPPFVAQLRRRIAELGLQERIEAQVADMRDLPFRDGSFDVVWSEGAIFIVGFAKGLELFRRLIRPGGYLAVSELCRFKENPAAEVLEFFESEGAEADEMESRRATVAAKGYQLLADFVLPAKAWRENYHLPLARTLERFRSRHRENPQALAVASQSEREIEVYRRHGDDFGYAFFIMRRP